ncbi:MAG: TIR domain-containing protein [Actinomycetota bacterium]|nr:TIR domain-containing protein [Actinomycetota bacterium]
MGYDAFVSYSHAADGRLAPALQLGLQRLARPWYRLRALAIFRDETGLAVSPQLWASIVRALDDSEWFVVLCSPEAAASEWVEREINHWLAGRRADRILLVLTNGEFVWDRFRADFDPVRSTALPPALLDKFGDEPRHLDLRWARGEEQLDVRHVRFRAAVAELAAPIRNMARDDLDAEDVRQHRRTLRLARGAATVVVLLFLLALTLAGFAFKQRAHARHETSIARREANRSRARELAADAGNASHIGRADLALLLAVEGSRLDSDPFVRAALFGAVLDQPALMRQLHGLSSSVTVTALSPDGRTLAAGDSNGQIMLWDVASGRPLAHQPVVDRSEFLDDLGFANGGTLLVAERDNHAGSSKLDVWDVRSGHLSRTIRPNSATLSPVTTSTRAAVLATLSPQGADVWDARTGILMRTVPVPVPSALSADGALIASAEVDANPGGQGFVEVVQVWKIATAQQLSPECRSNVGERFFGDNVRMPPDRPYILNVAFDPTGRTITTALSGGTNAVISRCDVSSGRTETTRMDVKTSSRAPVVAVSADRTSVATRDVEDGTIRIFDRASGQMLDAIRAPTEGTGDFNANSVLFAPDGHTFTARDTTAADVNVWSSRSVQPALERQTPPVVVAKSGDVVAWDPSGATLAVRPSFDVPLVRIIDRRTGRQLAQGNISTPLDDIAYSSDGRRVAVASSTAVTVWDLPSAGAHTFDLVPTACRSGIGSVAFTAEARTLAVSCSDGSLAWVDISTTTARLISTDPSGPPTGAGPPPTFSPDGRYLIASSTCRGCRTLDLLDVSGDHIRRRRVGEVGTNGVNAVAFSNTGHTFATSNGDGRIELWYPYKKDLRQSDLSTRGDLSALGGNALSFSADGSLLAAGDCTAVRVWDIETTTLLGTFPQPGICPDLVDFAPNDQSISVTGLLPAASNTNAPNQPGSVAIVSSTNQWDLDIASWQRDACTIANRNLTPTEWTQYSPDIPYHKTCPDAP